jgi:Flp pilus assembly secretin CpaC
MNTIRNTTILLLLAGLVLFDVGVSRDAAAVTLGGTIQLSLGQQRVLDVPAALEQVAIGDPKVADVKIISEGKQILVTGLGKGHPGDPQGHPIDPQ